MALHEEARELLGWPEVGLGHSRPALGAGFHLPPLAEVGLQRRGGGELGLPAADPRERPKPQAGQPVARQPGPDY